MTKAEQTAYIQVPQNRITILFEDQHLIVLSKPPNLLSQGEHTGDINLVDILRDYWKRNYVGLIHRLDRNTSGIMIVAKRTKSAQRLTDALQEGKIHRTYLGWTIGTLKAEVQWKHQLQKNPRTNQTQVVTKGGKPSSLLARPIKNTLWNQIPVTLIEFVLETGRSHQIRVQSSFEGFPLLGDTKYSRKSALPGSTPPFHRVALHSHRLSFCHPMSGTLLEFNDPLPEDLQLDAISNP